MAKRQPKVATIITGVDKSHTFLFRQHALQSLGDFEEVHLIQHLGAEAALADGAVPTPPLYPRYPDTARYAIRDILETRAWMAWRAGSRYCLFIAQVTYNPEEEYFGECQEFAFKARETIGKWGLFRPLDIVCFTPDKQLVPL